MPYICICFDEAMEASMRETANTISTATAFQVQEIVPYGWVLEARDLPVLLREAHPEVAHLAGARGCSRSRK